MNMTAQQIRDAIAASPELQALAAVRNDAEIARLLSVGRTKFVPTEVGNGTILEVLGFATGNTVLDLIANTPTYRYVKPLVEQGRLRLDSTLVQQTLASLVTASVLTQAQADALSAKAKVSDPVSVDAVSAALNEVA